MSQSAKLVRGLYEVACYPDKGFGFQANEILRLGCELLGVESGIIYQTNGQEETIRFAISPLVEVPVGQVLPSCEFYGLHSHYSGEIEGYGGIVFASRDEREGNVVGEYLDTVNLISLWLSREIDRLKREKALLEAAKKLQALVKFDSLTGMYSRPSIEGRLRRLLKRSKFTSDPVSAAVIDIDDFRQIQTRFGKTGADMALTAVAQAIDEAVRPTDPSARIGDDEFLVILVGANESQAKTVSQRIQECIAASHIEVAGKKVQLSASIAVTELSEEITHIEEILKDTHTRLMLAKKKGKNRVV